jgi:hypothetical protein
MKITPQPTRVRGKTHKIIPPPTVAFLKPTPLSLRKSQLSANAEVFSSALKDKAPYLLDSL